MYGRRNDDLGRPISLRKLRESLAAISRRTFLLFLCQLNKQAAYRTHTIAYHNARLEYSQIRLYTESNFKSGLCRAHIFHTLWKTLEDRTTKAIICTKNIFGISRVVKGVTLRLRFMHCALYCYYNRRVIQIGSARKFYIFKGFLCSK